MRYFFLWFFLLLFSPYSFAIQQLSYDQGVLLSERLDSAKHYPTRIQLLEDLSDYFSLKDSTKAKD